MLEESAKSANSVWGAVDLQSVQDEIALKSYCAALQVAAAARSRYRAAGAGRSSGPPSA